MSQLNEISDEKIICERFENWMDQLNSLTRLVTQQNKSCQEITFQVFHRFQASCNQTYHKDPESVSLADDISGYICHSRIRLSMRNCVDALSFFAIIQTQSVKQTFKTQLLVKVKFQKNIMQLWIQQTRSLASSTRFLKSINHMIHQNFHHLDLS